jgi:hypothetical protein
MRFRGVNAFRSYVAVDERSSTPDPGTGVDQIGREPREMKRTKASISTLTRSYVWSHPT